MLGYGRRVKTCLNVSMIQRIASVWQAEEQTDRSPKYACLLPIQYVPPSPMLADGTLVVAFKVCLHMVNQRNKGEKEEQAHSTLTLCQVPRSQTVVYTASACRKSHTSVRGRIRPAVESPPARSSENNLEQSLPVEPQNLIAREGETDQAMPCRTNTSKSQPDRL